MRGGRSAVRGHFRHSAHDVRDGFGRRHQATVGLRVRRLQGGSGQEEGSGEGGSGPGESGSSFSTCCAAACSSRRRAVRRCRTVVSASWSTADIVGRESSTVNQPGGHNEKALSAAANLLPSRPELPPTCRTLASCPAVGTHSTKYACSGSLANAASKHSADHRFVLMERNTLPSLSVDVSHEITIALAKGKPSAGRAGWKRRQTGLPYRRRESCWYSRTCRTPPHIERKRTNKKTETNARLYPSPSVAANHGFPRNGR